MPFIFEDRVGGVSKISKKIIFEAFWKVPFFISNVLDLSITYARNK